MIYSILIILNIFKFSVFAIPASHNSKNYSLEIKFQDSTNNKKRDSLYLDSVRKVIQYKTSNYFLNKKNKSYLGQTLIYKN